MSTHASASASAAATAETPTSGPEKTYFDFLAAGEWRIPHCLGCTRAVFFPRVICPFCSSRAFDWRCPSGGATVYSTTVMRRPDSAGGDLNLCLVDLDEGVRMMSRVVGVAPAVPKIGDRVRARVERDNDVNLVVFTLEHAS